MAQQPSAVRGLQLLCFALEAADVVSWLTPERLQRMKKGVSGRGSLSRGVTQGRQGSTSAYLAKSFMALKRFIGLTMLRSQHLNLHHLLIVSVFVGKKFDQLGFESLIGLGCNRK
ncbi:MAG TPA: hypothetical protein VFP71_02700 [Candidatus Angelobacter sp.]|nr:hypothetical protein [Candidatus Angelobacter sp.]